MATPNPGSPTDPRETVQSILLGNRLMSVATLRPDGWPHVTLVGYVSDGLVLYFVIATNSQKLENIRRDQRVSIAMGHLYAERGRLHGLSMAGIAEEISSSQEVEQINAVVLAHRREQAVFAPRGGSVAIIRVTPKLISLIDAHAAVDQATLLEVRADPSTGELSLTPAIA